MSLDWKNTKTRIVITPNYKAFIELAESIKYALTTFGVTEIDIQDLNVKNFKDVQRFYAAKYDLTFMMIALRSFNAAPIKGIKILFQTEELWNRREKNNYFGLGSADYHRVLEMYDENVKIGGNTRNVVYCPVGYSPAWEVDLPKVKEDIDVFFHGSITDRRKEFLRMITSAVGKEKTYLFTQDAWGLKREKLIMRSKIVINIKAHDNWSYGPMHCLPSQANKKFMLAEKGNGGYGPFVPGIHVAEYDGIQDCKEKVLYWLSHEKERKEFAEKAYIDMKKNCDFTKILKKALGSVPGKPHLGSFF